MNRDSANFQSLPETHIDIMSCPTEAQIIEAVDKLREDAVQMLHEIVSHPSLLGDEKSVQDFMESKFKQLKDPQLAVKRVPIIRTFTFCHILPLQCGA